MKSYILLGIVTLLLCTIGILDDQPGKDWKSEIDFNNPNKELSNGDTALTAAINHHDTRLIEQLLRTPNINVNAPDAADEPPLIHAVKKDDYFITSRLLTNGASVNLRPSPLFFAKSPRMIDLLVAHKAHINSTFMGKTILQIALEKKQVELIPVILKHMPITQQVLKELINHEQPDLLKQAITASRYDINTKDIHGQSLLNYTYFQPYISEQIISTLLDLGANPDDVNTAITGKTPLQNHIIPNNSFILQPLEPEYYAKNVHLLLEHGANTSQISNHDLNKIFTHKKLLNDFLPYKSMIEILLLYGMHDRIEPIFQKTTNHLSDNDNHELRALLHIYHALDHNNITSITDNDLNELFNKSNQNNTITAYIPTIESLLKQGLYDKLYKIFNLRKRFLTTPTKDALTQLFQKFKLLNPQKTPELYSTLFGKIVLKAYDAYLNNNPEPLAQIFGLTNDELPEPTRFKAYRFFKTDELGLLIAKLNETYKHPKAYNLYTTYRDSYPLDI